MNRNIVLILLALLLTVSTRAQKHISREYNNVSISDALNGLAEQQTDYAIMFLYNELEDFRITTTIRRKTLPEAIQQMIGFYPIRMTVDTSDPEGMKIFVECTHKTDRHLTGTIIDEQGQPVSDGGPSCHLKVQFCRLSHLLPQLRSRQYRYHSDETC